MRLNLASALLAVSLLALNGCGGTGNTDYFALQIDGEPDREYKDSWMQSSLQTADGGMIVVGNVGSLLWVMKFDRNGNVTWEYTYGEAFWKDKGLHILSDGAYAISGAKGSGGAFFIIIEPNGAVRSLQHFPDFYFGGSQLTDDGVYLMGEAPDGSVLLKVDNNGNLVNANFYSTLTNLTELLELPSGELVIAGERGNTFSDTGRVDLVLLKTNSQGMLTDTAVYGNDRTGVFTGGLYLNARQQIVLGGYTQLGTFMDADNFEHPIRLVFNQDLSIASAQEYTFNREAAIADAIPASDGGMIMSGRFRQTNDSWTQTHSALLKLDSNGTIEWAKRYEFNSSTNESDGRSVAETNRGYLMTGYLRQNGVYGFVVSANFDGVIEGSGSVVVNLTNGTVNNFSLATYSDQDIFWQSYGQVSYGEPLSASPSTSVVTRLDRF
ncbi:MAG: hypothetical protein R3208_15585 [Ketobacteraceae bacterium]|nr:hypothetical protein [Ketobacteraceae bacterium]